MVRNMWRKIYHVMEELLPLAMAFVALIAAAFLIAICSSCATAQEAVVTAAGQRSMLPQVRDGQYLRSCMYEQATASCLYSNAETECMSVWSKKIWDAAWTRETSACVRDSR